MASNEDVIAGLDRIAAILKLALRDEIEQSRTQIRSDKVNAAILDAAKRWVGARAMQAKVAAKTKASTRTIQERIAELLVAGVLDKRGGGPTTEYRASGLI
jgi:hypothetical protein